MFACTRPAQLPRLARRASRSSTRAMASAFHALSAKTLTGDDFPFSKLEGKAVLITNVASACGYTRGNYAELQKLQDTYGDKGLVILAFPCNQFGAQESGSPDQICEFAKGKGATFQLMEKINVNGPATHPVWKYLKQEKPGDVNWNFGAKFIIDKSGAVVARNGDSPLASEATIKSLL